MNFPRPRPLPSLALLDRWGGGEPSDLARAIADARARHGRLIDLIGANPQEHGFEFPPDSLADILAAALPKARLYAPDARGRLDARESVAAYHGNGLSPENVILTPGTSLAYWYAFRLLANSGDEVLCPSPTYPLFADLAELAGLDVRRYHLRSEHGNWSIDPAEIEFQITPRTRILAIVSPHNPTGMVATNEQLAAIADIARRHNLAIVFDEVFREFRHTVNDVLRPSAFDAPLCLTLNGFSKMFSLPGIKAAWIAVEGNTERARPLLNALEYMSDTFLPVNEIVQAAIPAIFEAGRAQTARFSALLTERMSAIRNAWNQFSVSVPQPDAGPYLTVPVGESSTASPDSAASILHPLSLRLLNDHGILLHPGDYYELPNHLVMTCHATPPWPIETIARVIHS